MEEVKPIYDKLLYMQQNLSAPKDKTNAHGGYKYRSAESILEAAKPLLAEVKCTLRLYDEVIEVGQRIYIKATAVFTDGADTLTSSGFAREGDRLGGMSEPQITGASSSYARKTALCGLLALDDNKDPDELPPTKAKPQPQTQKPKAAAAEILSEALGDKKQDKEVYPYAGIVETLKAAPKPQAPLPKSAENVDELPF